MKITRKLIVALAFISVFASCSNDDSTDPELPISQEPEPEQPEVVVTPKVEFTDLSISKALLFTDQAITVAIKGNNFNNVEFTYSDNAAITSTKVNDSIYELKSSTSVKSNVTVSLQNGDDVETKSVDVEFVQHGVFQSRIVEGINVDFDGASRVLELFGEPDRKQASSSGNFVNWLYLDEGIDFAVTSSSSTVTSVFINTASRLVNVDGTDSIFRPYPHSINNMFNFSDSERNGINEVVSSLGQPTFTLERGAPFTFPEGTIGFKRETSPPDAENNRRGLYEYVYFYNNNPDNALRFSFFADSIDSYQGEFISSITIF